MLDFRVESESDENAMSQSRPLLKAERPFRATVRQDFKLRHDCLVRPMPPEPGLSQSSSSAHTG